MACASNDLADLSNLPATSHEGRLNAASILKYGDDVVFKDRESQIKIKVTTIKEWRCPSDVNCVQGGHAKVSFHILAINKTVDLAIPHDTFRGQFDNYEFSVNNTNYTLILNDVHPYPSTKNEKETKTAEFVLTETPN
jgi:hypothetical protein